MLDLIKQRSKLMEPVLEQMKAQALKDLEVLLKNQVAVAYDSAAEVMKAKLKEIIPGTVDDAVIEMIAAPMLPALKALLLEQIEKISA